MIVLIDEFKKELSDIAEFAQSTVDNYVACITAFFDYARNRLRIDPVFARGRHILDWIGQVKSSGVSKSRLEHHRSALKLFFGLMVKLDIRVKNPVDKLPPIRRFRNSERNRPVDPAVVFKLLAAIDRSGWRGIRDHLIIAMLWALGLRVSELTALEVKHFEPDHDADNRIGLLRVQGKNKKQRALFVIDKLYDELVDHLEHLWSPAQINVPIFPIDTGTAISNNRVLKMIKERCRQAGITERITPHVLRHGFATDMYHAGVPLDEIQTMMGHDHKAETAVYVHVSDRLKKQALVQIGLQGGLSWA
jgi:integrase/recombinase XerD